MTVEFESDVSVSLIKIYTDNYINQQGQIRKDMECVRVFRKKD